MSTIYDAVTGKPLHPRVVDSVIGPRVGYVAINNPVTVQLAGPEKAPDPYVPPITPIEEKVEPVVVEEPEFPPQYSDYA